MKRLDPERPIARRGGSRARQEEREREDRALKHGELYRQARFRQNA